MRFGWKRVQNLIQKGTEQRKQWCKSGDPLDVVSIIQFDIPFQVVGFHWDVIEDSEWMGSHEEDAFVVFQQAGSRIFPSLSVRESVWEKAVVGDYSSRFTLAHEIAHIFLHKKLAGAKLARESHKSLRNRTNPTQEKEANIFAGALLVDVERIKGSTGIFEIRSKYRVSSDVARHVLDQISYVRKKRGF